MKSEECGLLDSGDGRKLERFGSVVLDRPDPQVLWPQKLSESEWAKADAVFEHGAGAAGRWRIKTNIPEDWKIKLEENTFCLKLLPSKHVGVFPEQVSQWVWLGEKVKPSSRKVSILNLFANTGGATLACARAGAEVTHVDASQGAVDMAFKNRDASGLSGAPIRFIVDDVRAFVEKEIKRGQTYDVILLDPPVYGKGPTGTAWNLDTDVMPLVLRLKSLLSKNPIAIVLSGYASNYSTTTYANILAALELSGKIESGELFLHEKSGRQLSAGIFARWEK